MLQPWGAEQQDGSYSQVFEGGQKRLWGADGAGRASQRGRAEVRGSLVPPPARDSAQRTEAGEGCLLCALSSGSVNSLSLMVLGSGLAIHVARFAAAHDVAVFAHGFDGAADLHLDRSSGAFSLSLGAPRDVPPHAHGQTRLQHTNASYRASFPAKTSPKLCG